MVWTAVFQIMACLRGYALMNTFLLWMHSLVQTVAAVLGFLAMWQGIKRTQIMCGKKIIFPWKQHVKLGTWCLCQWILCAFVYYTARAVFGYVHITGLHIYLVWPIIALALLGLASGYVMDRYKKKRKWLPIFHGLSNSILICLVLLECWTGIKLCFHFL